MTNYPKRLIEVDLPIKRISAHARREKSIRHGHISTLHIWWARRPLAACRAVICAALWPDPADPLCPQAFRDKAAELMTKFATKAATSKLMESCSPESIKRWMEVNNNPKSAIRNPKSPEHLTSLRSALLDFIADFANWDNSTVKEYLETSRALTQAAHEALGGEPGTRPLVVDPFAGGGSIPLEALRVGADAFASDLNPVAVLLNKVVLEYIPKYGQRLADEVRKWGEWIKKEAEKELAEFYPKDPDGATPIAYLWARTIKCEGPGCGAEVPMMRSLWLAKKGNQSVGLRIVKRAGSKQVGFEIVGNAKPKDIAGSTVARGSATCPICGYTTPVTAIRDQMKKQRGGAGNARLVVIRRDNKATGMREYRLPTKRDLEAVDLAALKLEKLKHTQVGPISLVPSELVNPLPHSVNRLPIYGMTTWSDVFSPRQLVALCTFARIIQKLDLHLGEINTQGLGTATQACLALMLDRLADFNSSLCVLNAVGGRGVVHTFGRQALPMVWDFMETNPFNDVGANWEAGIEAFVSTIRQESVIERSAVSQRCSATSHILPDYSAQAFVTDPPYYDMISYADLSDFFYVWLRRTLSEGERQHFSLPLVPKSGEIIVEPTPVEGVGIKDKAFYIDNMRQSLSEGRRILSSSSIGVVVFAHKSTSGWEAQLQALIEAGWIVTGSWPLDTERESRVSALGQARLASSIHLVCRPREIPDGSVRTDQVGDWREVLAELPKRIHEWMPRLAQEGVVGADAIFACLGPALEIFSRYSRVEKASGEQVTLKEYLEHVWAAVAKEALALVFEGADTAGFEEDARLTAMWLWTLRTDQDGIVNGESGMENGELDDEDETSQTSNLKPQTSSGYTLEYDAARKIAQGLGAHLEQLASLVEVKGEKARLLPVEERARYLFGKDSIETQSKRKKKEKQMGLFEIVDEAEDRGPKAGKNTSFVLANTVLDRVHQSMLLFATGRSEALRRFLVDDGVGRDQRFWKLAQSLSALYPKSSDEKRWVDGMLARKKGLGF